MQRLTTVAWSLDNKYVLSGSDKMCIRLWKARASERIGIMRDRERVALQYNEKLKEKYGQHPQIARWILSSLRHSSLLILPSLSRIARHRQVPRHVKSSQAEIRSIKVDSLAAYVTV